MQKIIDGKIYDTNNAYLINTFRETCFGFLSCDTYYEKIYLTKDDNSFFLYTYNSGGVLLFFDIIESIKPLTYEEAIKYLKGKCSSNKLRKILIYLNNKKGDSENGN